jgi:hypothetical protein
MTIDEPDSDLPAASEELKNSADDIDAELQKLDQWSPNKTLGTAISFIGIVWLCYHDGAAPRILGFAGLPIFLWDTFVFKWHQEKKENQFLSKRPVLLALKILLSVLVVPLLTPRQLRTYNLQRLRNNYRQHLRKNLPNPSRLPRKQKYSWYWYVLAYGLAMMICLAIALFIMAIDWAMSPGK